MHLLMARNTCWPGEWCLPDRSELLYDVMFMKLPLLKGINLTEAAGKPGC